MTPWADLGAGDRVAWTTPSFRKIGLVVDKRGGSLRVLFDGDPRSTVIPHAKWYWNQAKEGDKRNRLELAMPGLPDAPEELPFDPDWASVSEAVALFNLDPKQLRRWIRAGKVEASMRRGVWSVNQLSLTRFLADRG